MQQYSAWHTPNKFVHGEIISIEPCIQSWLYSFSIERLPLIRFHRLAILLYLGRFVQRIQFISILQKTHNHEYSWIEKTQKWSNKVRQRATERETELYITNKIDCISLFCLIKLHFYRPETSKCNFCCVSTVYGNYSR